MTSGDSPLQVTILQAVKKEADERIELDEERWLEVIEVAEMYAEAYLAEQQRQAEKEILKPLG